MDSTFEQIKEEAQYAARAREDGIDYQWHVTDLSRRFHPQDLQHAAKQFKASVEESQYSELLARVCIDAARKGKRLGRRNKWSKAF